MSTVRKSRSRAVLFGVLAVVIAGSTAFAAYSLVSQYEDREKSLLRDSETQNVVVAVENLRPGTVVTPKDVELRPRPVGKDLASYFTSIDAILGQAIGDRVLAGEAVRIERMLVGGANLSLDEIIEPGMRATTVRTGKSSGVGGYLKPGNYVDVMLTIKPEDRRMSAEWVTETIVQAAKVLAVNEILESAPAPDPSEQAKGKKPPKEFFVTLEVAQEESEALALATTRGEIQLSLRARDDFEIVETDGPLVVSAIVGMKPEVQQATQERVTRQPSRPRLQSPPPQPKTPQATTTVTVVRGQASTDTNYGEDGQPVAAEQPKRQR